MAVTATLGFVGVWTALVCAYVYRTALSVGTLAPPSSWDTSNPSLSPNKLQHSIRTETTIPLKNEESIHAWLYIPKHRLSATPVRPPPLVVLGHGIGAQKDFGLDTFADGFAHEGIASLAIDYRHFGGSSGTPRNLIWPWNHVDDIIDTVRWVKAGGLGSDIDASRIALWGTSFAGGHVIMAGAALGSDIKCIVSQVPHLDGRAASKRNMKTRGIKGVLLIACVGIVDWIRAALGLSPLYVRIASTKDDLVAFMPLGESDLKSYFAKHPKPGNYLGGWKNLAAARMLPLMAFYSPIHQVQNLKVPSMFISAKKDSLCPFESVRAAYNKTDGVKSRLLEMDTSHFDLYIGDNVKRVISEQSDFLRTYLQP